MLSHVVNSFLFLFRIRKLPKALKEWQAFLDLKKTIDDFSESCPLLEMMAHKAMKARHWERISNVTKTPLDVESETFSLRSLMSAPLLENKEDIEVCFAFIPNSRIVFIFDHSFILSFLSRRIFVLPL